MFIIVPRACLSVFALCNFQFNVVHLLHFVLHFKNRIRLHLPVNLMKFTHILILNEGNAASANGSMGKKIDLNEISFILCQFSMKLFHFLLIPNNYQWFDSSVVYFFLSLSLASPTVFFSFRLSHLVLYEFSHFHFWVSAQTLCELIKSRVKVYLLNLHENRGHVLILASCVLLEI